MYKTIFKLCLFLTWVTALWSLISHKPRPELTMFWIDIILLLLSTVLLIYNARTNPKDKWKLKEIK